MRLQKIIMCAAAALTAFGAGVGLLEAGNYLYSGLRPSKLNVSSFKPAPQIVNQSPVIEKAQAETSEDKKYVHKEFSEPGEDGYYYLIGTPAMGNNPKAFKDFDYFELETYRIEEKTYKRVPIKPTGWLSAGKNFDFARLKISGRKISFTTETRKGVFYRLEGKFVDETIIIKVDGEDYADTIALKGTLTKWKNGVKIAKAKVSFSFTVGC